MGRKSEIPPVLPEFVRLLKHCNEGHICPMIRANSMYQGALIVVDYVSTLISSTSCYIIAPWRFRERSFLIECVIGD